MAAPKYEQSAPLIKDVIQAFDQVNGGAHSGYRPAHAKGILLAGLFTPSAGGRALTGASHLHRESTPVTVRFSDFAGVPTVPDNDPNASPRGFAVRFHLGEHVHTDIIGHSVDGFPVRTAEEFAEFLKAAGASGPGAPKPSPVEVFLGSHPAALAFVTVAKPFPTSFAKESFFSVNAYKFVSQSGAIQFGRYRIRPDGEGEYLDAATAAAKSANFLFDEIRERLGKGPVKLHIFVQLAAPGDVVDDATIHWPEDRPQIEFGTLELSNVHPDSDGTQRQIIFDPIPRVDGIEASEDPLLEARAAVYLATGRRRRAGGGK
jgi:catalase